MLLRWYIQLILKRFVAINFILPGIVVFGGSTAIVCSAMVISSSKSNTVQIPAGIYRSFFTERFSSGSDLVFPEIQIDAFTIDRYPVTNGQFLEFVTSNSKWKRDQISNLFADVTYLKHWSGDLELSNNAPFDSPVVYVSWFAAKAYCAWHGKRLPTTTEWEYLASSDLYKGRSNENPQQIILEWYGRPTLEIQPKVGTMPANKLGVYDLHGLVWEWTLDFNSVMIENDDRKGSSSERGLFCGAGALGGLDSSAYADYMRMAFRSSIKGGFTLGNLGFRCAK